MVKLGIVGDIHCGPDTASMRGSRAPALLDKFLTAMREFRPDAVVELGDRITDVAHAEDRERSAWVRRQLLTLGAPVFHVLGNHDVVNVAKAELGAILDKRGPYESASLDGVRLIVLDSQDPPVEGIGGGIGPEQLRWLEATLAETALPVIVFCHHPLDEQSLKGHWYFATRPTHAFVRERGAIRGVLSRSRRVLAAFSGHLHWTRADNVDGVPYVTLGSLVDAGLTQSEPAGTFACVTVEGGSVDVQVAGRFAERFRLTSFVPGGGPR